MTLLPLMQHLSEMIFDKEISDSCEVFINLAYLYVVFSCSQDKILKEAHLIHWKTFGI
jgi:hypothetical protein